MTLPAQRTPHPIASAQQALANHQSVCAIRGHCGPFINVEFYNAYPDSFWHGYGECLICRSTCLVAAEETKAVQRRPSGSGAASFLPPEQLPDPSRPAES